VLQEEAKKVLAQCESIKIGRDRLFHNPGEIYLSCCWKSIAYEVGRVRDKGDWKG
jgi:hypothetical protein